MENIRLIVDDEPIIRELLQAILREEGSKILEAENAPQAFMSAAAKMGTSLAVEMEPVVRLRSGLG
jgi:CheY-like chemotaxis protein